MDTKARMMTPDQRQAHGDEHDWPEGCEICDSTCGDCYGGMDDPYYHCPQCGGHVDDLDECPDCSDDYQTCDACEDRVHALSSRGLCDGCEAEDD